MAVTPWDNEVTVHGAAEATSGSAITPPALKATATAIPKPIRNRDTLLAAIAVPFRAPVWIRAGIIDPVEQPLRRSDHLRPHLDSNGPLQRFWRKDVDSAVVADNVEIPLGV